MGLIAKDSGLPYDDNVMRCASDGMFMVITKKGYPFFADSLAELADRAVKSPDLYNLPLYYLHARLSKRIVNGKERWSYQFKDRRGKIHCTMDLGGDYDESDEDWDEDLPQT